MHETFPAIKSQFSEISLERLTQILAPPKVNPNAKRIDKIIEIIFAFENRQVDVQLQIEEVKHSGIEKEDFFSLLRRSVAKHLKKNQLSIECVIQYKNRAHEPSQQRRYQTQKILNEFLKKIEDIGVKIYRLISDVEFARGWGCKCNSEQCQARKSLQQFHIDIFLYLIRSSQILKDQMQTSFKNIYFHLILPFEEIVRHQNNLDQQTFMELKFQLEMICEQPKNKKKKKNKKQKTKTIEKEQTVEMDEDERMVTEYLQKLKVVDEERTNCVVSEEWLQRIRPQYKLNKK